MSEQELIISIRDIDVKYKNCLRLKTDINLELSRVASITDKKDFRWEVSNVEDECEISNEIHWEMRRFIPTDVDYSSLPKSMQYGDTNRCMCFKFVQLLLDQKDFKEIINVHNRIGLSPKLSMRCWEEKTKELTVLSKSFGDMWTLRWRYFVDWNLFLGYDTKTKKKDESDVLKWGITPVVHVWPQSGEDEYNSIFRNSVLAVLRSGGNIDGSRRKMLSVREFVSNPDLWVTQGSSPEGKVEVVNDEGRKEMSAGNKMGVALKHSVAELEHIMVTYEQEVFKVDVKRELGMKLRHIVSANWKNQLRMAYLSSFFERMLSGSPLSSLFMDNAALQKRFSEMVADSMSSHWSVDYDAKEFDSGVSRGELQGIKFAMNVLLEENFPPISDNNVTIKHIFNLTWHVFETTRVKINNRYYIWNHGVPSGIRWTALWDTLVSCARLKMIERKWEIMTGEKLMFLPSKTTAQGDDIEARTRDVTKCVFTLEMMEMMNIEGNVRKTLIKKSENEYLRRTFNQQGMRGYLCRKIPSILLRSAIAKPQTVGKNRWNEIIKDMLVLCGRGAIIRNTIKQLIHNLRNSIFVNETDRLSNSVITCILHTPACVGGFGFRPYCGKWMVLSPSRELPTWQYLGSLGTYQPRVEVTSEITGVAYPDVERMVRDNINSGLRPRGKRMRLISPSSVKDVAMFSALEGPLSKVGFWSRKSKSFSLRPNLSSDSLRDGILLDVVVKDFSETGDDTILLSILDDLSRDTLVVLNRPSVSRGLLYAWLKDDLPFKAPSMSLMSVAAVSDLHAKNVYPVWTKLLARNNVSMSSVKAAALYCERITSELCDLSSPGNVISFFSD